MIKVKVQADISRDGRPVNDDAVEACILQCVADAVEGSFDEYPGPLRDRLRLKAQLIDDRSERREQSTRVDFDFGLPDELFPVGAGGLQLLVSLLAGDMFPSEVRGCQWSNARVLAVELPEDLGLEATRTFRDDRAHSVRDLRALFELPDERPLLAFSLKPRVGLTYEETREITLRVLGAGFNLVELDARNLALRSAPLERWIELGIEAAGVESHRTAFAPNLSIPPDQLIDVGQQWTESIAPYGPAVIKVDGGLDGLSGIQSLRRHIAGPARPICTCYPVLRNQLSSAIGPTTWVEFLSLSGVDIIYPGGRPTFPNERRPVWGAHVQAWSRAARTYDDFLTRGWPMPTIAGGIHPGHLHACYELLGPQVAYFLGGAVALHPEGPEKGAELCVRVLEEAITLARQANEAGDPHAYDLPDRLLREVTRVQYPTTQLNYYSPGTLFRQEGPQDIVPQTFYRRAH
jgi:ribulose 1,5-bisphosphate carboxylase large subunit-like protein